MLAVMQQTMKESRAGKRPRRAKAEWVEEVGRWRRSGQSAAEYAAAHGLHPGTLGWWGSRIGSAATVQVGTQRSEPVRFLPVRVTERRVATALATPKGEVEVVLRNGRRVRICGDFQNDVVARLLDIAEGGDRC
jgi:transposase